MGDENPIRTLGDCSKPSHEGYRNTIELPDGNNVFPLRSDTIRLVQKGCSFHGLRFEDPNQHLKDFLKLVDSPDLNVANKERTRLCLFQFSLRDQGSNWLERLPTGSISTCNIKSKSFMTMSIPPQGEPLISRSVNDPRDFAKPVKAISLPEDVLSTSDRRLIELENQVQRLMEDHLAPKSTVQWRGGGVRAVVMMMVVTWGQRGGGGSGGEWVVVMDRACGDAWFGGSDRSGVDPPFC
ncbi:hypothetical protein Tco_0967405 [Tanacetum coccineum]